MIVEPMDILNEMLGIQSGSIKEGAQIAGIYGTLHKGGDKEMSKMKAFEVTDIRFNVNHKTGQKTTCVMFGDGDKVVVKLSENDHEDPYTAFCAAVVKKIFGSTSKAQRALEKASHGVYKRRQEPKKKAEPIGTVKSVDITPDGVEVKATWNNPEMLERLKLRYGLQYNDDSKQIFNRLMNDKLEGK